MKKLLIAALLVSASLAAGAVAIAHQRASDPEYIVGQFVEQHGIPGAVLAYGDAGEQPHIEAFGNLTPNSMLPMASLTKSVTAETIMRLVDEKRLSLDTQVGDVVAVDNPKLATVTVGQLLQHEGGFGRDEKRCERAEELDLPVGKPSYANRNYCWLGRIAEKVTGQSFVELASDTMDGPAILTSPDFEAAGGLSADATTLFRFFSRRPHATTLPTVQVASYLPPYRAGWNVFPDGSTGHWGTTGIGQGSLAVASQTSDGKVFVVVLNKRPEYHRAVYASLQRRLTVALSESN